MEAKSSREIRLELALSSLGQSASLRERFPGLDNLVCLSLVCLRGSVQSVSAQVTQDDDARAKVCAACAAFAQLFERTFDL